MSCVKRLWVLPVFELKASCFSTCGIWGLCDCFWGGFLTFILYFQVLPLTKPQLLGLLCPGLQVSVTVLCFRPTRKMYQFLR